MNRIWQILFLGTVLSASAAPVPFESIAGTRQRLADDRIALAFGAPEPLFADGTAVAVRSGEVVPGRETAELAALPGLQGDAPFTIALFNAGETGRIRLELRDGSRTVGAADAELPASAWTRLALEPGSGSGRKLFVSGDGKAKLTGWTVYRSFEQLYGIGTAHPVENIFYQAYGKNCMLSPGLTPGSHRDDRGWNTPTAGERNGVPVAVVTEHYQPLLSCPRQPGSGIPLPVDTRNGALLVYRIWNNPVITLYAEKEGHRNCNIGKKESWNEGAIPIDAAGLDADRNGIWHGRPAVAWNQSDTLAQSYGKGDFAFVAVQSGNRIALPAGAKQIAFRYLGKDGKAVLFENPIPAGASAVALVNIGPGATQLVWKLPDGWTGGRVVRDSARNNSLIIEPNTFTIEETPKRQGGSL